MVTEFKMKVEASVQFKSNEFAQDIAQICGEVTVECSDAAGLISQQMDAATELRKKQLLLNDQSEKLYKELTSVAKATDDASALSIAAKKKLQNGNDTIENAIGSFEALIDLIKKQNNQIKILSSALEQVKNVTSGIDQIAKTTNMLALNAAIEAEKAGAAGATFAVVASEVKKLSNDTRLAADEITQTVYSMSREVRIFIDDLNAGVDDNRAAQNQLNELKTLITDVTSIIKDVEAKDMDIANVTAAIYETENSNILARKEVNEGNEEMHNNLINVYKKISNLEDKSNEMFDIFVKSGLSPNDTKYVEKSIHYCEEFRKITEDAIDAGVISIDDVFDTNLIKIEGSNPERFRNRLTSWADNVWQPRYDDIIESDKNIEGVICSATYGYLPTHSSEKSKTPIGDLAYDTANCRNGRVVFLPFEEKIKKSNESYTMVVYRQEGDGDNYIISRNVYVPLFIKGRRWGDFELAYDI